MPLGESSMSIASARTYARRAKQANDLSEAAKYFDRAIEELCKAVRDLEDSVKKLESRRSD
jgi:prefoldin subunit 5